MSKQTLNAKVRTASGKAAAKKLRQVGSIPAVMYNDKGEATMLEVNEVEFNKIWRSVTPTTSINLIVDGKENLALIKDTEYNIRTDKVLHAEEGSSRSFTRSASLTLILEMSAMIVSGRSAIAAFTLIWLLRSFLKPPFNTPAGVPE